MPVEKVDTHFRPHFRPSPTPLDKSIPWGARGWEIHLIGTCLSAGGCGTKNQFTSRYLTMIRL